MLNGFCFKGVKGQNFFTKLSPKWYFIKTLFLTLVAFVRYRIFAPSPRIGQLPYKEGGTPIAVSPSFPDET